MLVPPPIFGILLASTLPCCVAEVRSNIQKSVYCVTPSHDLNVACQTLDEYITDGTLNNSRSKFVFLNGTHHLTKSLMVYDSESLTLQGSEEGNNSVQVVCESRWTIALSFTRVSFLTIQNISFVNCSYNNSFSGYGQKEREYVISALHFEGGSNLTLSDVRILNCGFSIINTYGQVEITRMNVTSHLYQKINRHTTQSLGGSYLRYFSCDFQQSLTISESTFYFYKKFIFHLKSGDKNSAHGLSLTFNCTSIQLIIRKSRFYGFRSAKEGGNLMISLENSQYIPTRNNCLVKISECHFENGHAILGGGVYVSAVQPYLPNTPNLLCPKNANHIKFTVLHVSDSMFANNSGEGSGGLSFKLKELSSHPIVGCILVEHCKFTENYLRTKESHGGIAVHVSTYHAIPSTYHFTPTFNVTLSNCVVDKNYIRSDDTCSTGNGVIAIVTTLYFHVIHSEIIQNNCTAIKAIGSNLLLEGQVNITDNHGSSGGGLLLCDDSLVVLKPNTQVRIEQNNATHTGGGITVESQCLQTRPMCFFQLSKEITNNSSLLNTVNVILKNNRAGYAGHNLFGGSVDNCYLVDLSTYYQNKNLKTMNVFNKTFVNLTLANSSVTSTARRICFTAVQEV